MDDHRGAAREWPSAWLILTNRTYTGEATAWKGTVALPAGTVPPLVSRNDFDAVQAQLQRNKQAATRNNRTPEATLLRGGYARCGYCGRGLVVVRRATPNGMRHIYYCGRLAEPPPPGQARHGHGIFAHILDTAVWERIARLLTQPELIAVELERMRQDDPSTADLAAVERSLTLIAREQRNFVENLGKVSGPAADLIAEKINALEVQREQHAAEREAILRRQNAWQAAQERMGDITQWCRTVAGNLGTLSYQEKRLALDALGVQVQLWRVDHTPRYEIRASIPLDGIPAAEGIVCSTSR